MFKKLKKLFSSDKEIQSREAKHNIPPEVMGLRLGGSFTFNELSLKLAEESLVIDGANPHQIIQAVGVVELDSHHQIIRYYTDDEGYLQFNMYGETIQEISLWYIYDAKHIPESRWMKTVRHEIAKEEYQLDDFTYIKSFEEDEPVILTEKTHHHDGSVSTTDQFVMLYRREIENSECSEEMLLVSGEEKENVSTNLLEHEFVTYTGFVVKGHQITSN